MTRPITECSLWRWMPGMLAMGLTRDGRRCSVLAPDLHWRDLMRVDYGDDWWLHDILGDDRSWLPDPADPATVGCLLTLVREAWGMPGLGVHHDRLIGEWVFADVLSLPEPLREVFTATEWDALCVALWAASERAP